jgi:hypothetical protein
MVETEVTVRKLIRPPEEEKRLILPHNLWSKYWGMTFLPSSSMEDQTPKENLLSSMPHQVLKESLQSPQLQNKIH